MADPITTNSANITGFLNDLVAYGRLRSDFGVINTDLGIRWKEDNKFYKFLFRFLESLSKSFSIYGLVLYLEDKNMGGVHIHLMDYKKNICGV